MIAGYPASASVDPGDTLVLHVATTARRFRVLFYRWADGLLPVHVSGWLPGKCAAPPQRRRRLGVARLPVQA